MDILESRLVGKYGDPERCEDMIAFTGDHAAVFDGATRHTEQRWAGMKPGRRAAELCAEALGSLAADCTVDEALTAMTARIRREYESERCLDLMEQEPYERFAAAAAILSRARREVWLVHDCHAAWSGHTPLWEHPLNVIRYGMRAAVLELALAEGATVDELLADDRGHWAVGQMLPTRTVARFQNAPGQFGYAVIDGFPVRRDLVRVVRIPDEVREVSLCTDGYPWPRTTLAEAEADITRCLAEDPLGIRLWQAASPMREGMSWVDDRAYLRVRL